jgi:hypothetical protein
MLPLTLPIWLAGLAWLLATKPYRFLGITFLGVFAIVLVGHGKPYYLAPAFPLLYAAGGVDVERRLVRPVARGAVAALLAVGGAVVAPLTIPILEPASFVRYAAALGAKDTPDEKHEMGPLPQHFADQFGWEDMARQVADAYARLTPEERNVALVYVRNYGEAGAIEFFARRYALPPVACGHNAYFTWGLPQGRGEVLITIGEKGATLEETYEDVVKVGETFHPYAMPYENHRPIYVARKPRRDLHAIWPETKHYI